ncbi:hypothetical protein M885DRAFT_521598 [Pelagophyceae sp. CCMP2097]|nr:hypothetical protein M885DRAFT_521598 [Pelagophyceae sp. CCMP2097]
MLALDLDSRSAASSSAPPLSPALDLDSRSAAASAAVPPSPAYARTDGSLFGTLARASGAWTAAGSAAGFPEAEAESARGRSSLGDMRRAARSRADAARKYESERGLAEAERWSRARGLPGAAAMRAKAAHLRGICEWFCTLDASRDGVVDARELLLPFTVLGMARGQAEVSALARCIAAADEDGIPGLSRDEFLEFVRRNELAMPKQAAGRPRARGAGGAAAVGATHQTRHLAGLSLLDREGQAAGLDALELPTRIVIHRRQQVIECLCANVDLDAPAAERRSAELQEQLKTLQHCSTWANEAVRQTPQARARPAGPDDGDRFRRAVEHEFDARDAARRGGGGGAARGVHARRTGARAPLGRAEATLRRPRAGATSQRPPPADRVSVHVYGPGETFPHVVHTSTAPP